MVNSPFDSFLLVPTNQIRSLFKSYSQAISEGFGIFFLNKLVTFEVNVELLNKLQII
jgi:hypothetical protein